MKKILEFKIPDDNNDFEMANQGPAYHSVLWDITQKIRTYLKHGHSFKNADEALESIQKEIYEHMDDTKCFFQE